MNLLTVFSRAANYANLAPMERALLRFLSVLLWGALASGAQAAAPLLTSMDPTTIPWASVGHTFLAAFILAAALGVRKYSGALGDPPLPPPGPPATPAAPAPAPTTTPAPAAILPALPAALPAASADAPPASSLDVAAPAVPPAAPPAAG